MRSKIISDEISEKKATTQADLSSSSIMSPGVTSPETTASQSTMMLIHELPEFYEWLNRRGKLSLGTIHIYLNAVTGFLIESNGAYDDVDKYNECLVKHAVKKRSSAYYSALRNYVMYKFDGSKNKEKREHMLDVMKFAAPKKLSPKKKVHILSDDEIKRIISKMESPKHKLIAKIQYELGVRSGDVLRTRRGNIRYEPYKDRSLMVMHITGKGNKEHKMWIFDDALAFEIEKFIKTEWLDDEYYFIDRMPDSDLFVRTRACFLSYNSDIKKAMFLCGIPLQYWSTHDFRRRYARIIWEKTKDIMLLKEMLHHEYVETTARYLTHMGLEVQSMQEKLYNDKVAQEESLKGKTI
jgi:integrase